MAIDNSNQTILEGTSSDLLSEIQDEIYSFDVFLEQIYINSKDLRPEVQSAFEKMQSVGNEAKTISLQLQLHEKKIVDIERDSNVQKIRNQENRLKSTASSLDSARIRKEINDLEFQHKNVLSLLSAYKQNEMCERLRMIYCWTSILNYEIYILEDCKSLRISQIISLANSSCDESLINMTRKRLKSLSVHDSIINELTISPDPQNETKSNEIEKQLNQHLNEIQNITKELTNKKQIIRILNDISKEVRRETLTPPPEPSNITPSLTEDTETNNLSPPVIEKRPQKEARMTFLKKRK